MEAMMYISCYIMLHHHVVSIRKTSRVSHPGPIRGAARAGELLTLVHAGEQSNHLQSKSKAGDSNGDSILKNDD
jgi:hypothetical protein